MQIELKQIGLTQETDTVLDIFENDANVGATDRIFFGRTACR